MDALPPTKPTSNIQLVESRQLHRVALLVLVGLLLVQSWAVYAVDFLLTNDGPQHLLTAFVHRYYHSSSLRLDETWFISETLTDHGYREVFSFFASFMAWERADRVAFHVPVVVGSLGWLFVARWRGGAWAARGILLVGLSITWHYWMGFLPFSYASSVVPWVFYVFFRTELRRWLDVFVFAALLLMQAHCHPFPAMIGGGTIFALAVLSGRPSLAFRVGLGGVPAATLAFAIASATKVAVRGVTWDLDVNPLNALFETYIPGPIGHRLALLVLLLVLAASSLASWRTMPVFARRALVCAGLGVMLAPLLPVSVGTWDLVGPRTLTIFIPLAVALAADLHRPVAQLVLVVAMTAFSTTYLLWVRAQSLAVESAYGDVFEGARRWMPPQATVEWEFQMLEVLPHPRDVEVAIPYFSPGLHLPQALAVEKGGRPIYTQSDDPVLHGLIRPSRHPNHIGEEDINLPGLWSRFWGEHHDNPELRQMLIAAHFSRMATHDALFVVGVDADKAAMERAGYDVTVLGHTVRGLAIMSGAFVGCTVDIDLESLGDDVVELGLAPDESPIEALAIDAGLNLIRLSALPCGRWWVRTEQRLTTRGPPHWVQDVARRDLIQLAQPTPTSAP